MKGAPGGFTIIEVMIVLVISAVMLGSAITVFGNRRDSASFSQAIYDLQSQFKSIVNDISSQSIPGLQQYSCVPANVGGSMQPVLVSGGSTAQNCIYLGQALQIINNTGTALYSYPVFGLRTIYSGTTDTGNVPTSIDQVSANGVEKDLIGVYSNVSESNTSGNEVTIYPYNTTYTSIPDVTTTYTNIKSCVRTGCSMSSIGNSSWQLCLGDDVRSALFKAFMAPTGVNTSITYKNTPDCS
jgi:prepilin-type N-terminal cleavage/methylation domain-containing protein